MPEERPDLDPLRFQLQTLQQIHHQTEKRTWVHEGTICLPANVWLNLTIALTDLADCARRSL